MKRLSVADLAELQRVLEEAPAYARIQTGAGPTPTDAKEVLESLPPGRTPEDKFVFGFYLNRRMLGCADVIRGYPNGQTAMLGLLLLSEAHQGQGLGRAAYGLIEEQAKTWNCEKIRIGITSTNDRAIRFWRAMGFEDTGERKPYRCRSIVAETLVFEKPLSLPASELRLVPLEEKYLAEFRALLGSKDFGGCFCAVWTSYADNWGARCRDAQQPNFDITARDLKSGRHVGYLVYDRNLLVGWTGSGPKTSFPWLREKLGSRLTEVSNSVWSVACLAVPKCFRGQSYSQKMVEALIAEAKRNGAARLEAYPVRPFDESRVFRGTESLYRRTGFKEVACESEGESEYPVWSYFF